MILQTTQLSPSGKAAIEKTTGRKLQDRENIVFSGGRAGVANSAERQQAAELMRHQLFLLDPSERRMSIEDYAAALLEESDRMA